MTTLSRFLVEQVLAGPGDYVLDRQESHHAVNVLRLRAGDEVVVFDGRGNYAVGVVARADKAATVVAVAEVNSELRRPIEITIGTGIPKGKRWQMLVEKCTELGVDRLIPTLSGRSVVKGEGDSSRWRRWAVEAAKQSRRAFVPEVFEPMKLDEVLAWAAREKVLPLLADMDGDTPRAFQERIKEAGRVMVLIGPEGGFTDAEIKLYDSAGVLKIRLSPFILRIETAAATACALIRDM